MIIMFGNLLWQDKRNFRLGATLKMPLGKNLVLANTLYMVTEERVDGLMRTLLEYGTEQLVKSHKDRCSRRLP